MLDDLVRLLRGQARPAPRRRYAPVRSARPAKPIRTYARDLGWRARRQANGVIVHQGFFQAADQRWQGIVLEHLGRPYDVRMLRPPIGFIRGTKWEGCFHAIGADGWWRITFIPGLEPRDVDSALAAVNTILQECFRRAARRRW